MRSALARHAFRRLGQNLFGPLVEAFARKFCRQRGFPMNLRMDPEHHSAGIGLLGLLADLCAGFKVIVYGLMKGRTQISDVVGVEANSIRDASDPSEEDAVIIVILDTGAIAPV